MRYWSILAAILVAAAVCCLTSPINAQTEVQNNAPTAQASDAKATTELGAAPADNQSVPQSQAEAKPNGPEVNGIRVTVWNEGIHEKKDEAAKKVYPQGMGYQIAQYLEKQKGIASVHVSEIDDEEQGLSEAILNNTDVITWWGHVGNYDVTDEHVERVYQRVTAQGMGFIALHSAQGSKMFKRFMGTSCDVNWREMGEKERLWVVDPAHPIADGLPPYFELPHTEMYGEHFDIPKPDELVFVSWFQGGEVFRSGCCWHRGLGKIFYFRPGHETFPIYYDENVLKVIYNAVKWAAPSGVRQIVRGNVQPLENIQPAE